MKFWDERKMYRYLLWPVIAVHVLGLFVDVMEIDAAQYASISLEMLRDGHWLEIYHRHGDYLDKPPLLFWLSAMSFWLLGVTNFAYKLPSFLFGLLAMYATYRLTRLYYGRRAGRLAALILGTAQAFFLMTTDVRTDLLLTGAVATAIWQLAEYLENEQWKYLFGGFFFIGLALLAKGPIGLMVPVLAIGTDRIIRGRYRDLYRWQWLVGMVLVGLMLLPMLYGLYEQFDKHPEKLVNGRRQVSGLYFYLWEQSFGRITGESVWRDDSTPFFFVHTLLWAFLPWTPVLLAALWDRLRHLKDKRRYQEYMSVGGFVLTFLALSLSHYKLPHYLNVILPLGAMISGGYLDHLRVRPARRLRVAQYFVYLSLWILALILAFYIFTPVKATAVIVATGAMALAVHNMWRLPPRNGIVVNGILTAVAVNMILNLQVYPNLLRYQSTSAAGRWLRSRPEVKAHFAALKTWGHALDFYGRTIVPHRRSVAELRPEEWYLFTDDPGLKQLREAGRDYIIIRRFEDYPVTLLTLRFLDPRTRHNATTRKYIVRLNP